MSLRTYRAPFVELAIIDASRTLAPGTQVRHRVQFGKCAGEVDPDTLGMVTAVNNTQASVLWSRPPIELDLNVQNIAVNSKVRELNVKWSLETVEDLRACGFDDLMLREVSAVTSTMEFGRNEKKLEIESSSEEGRRTQVFALGPGRTAHKLSDRFDCHRDWTVGAIDYVGPVKKRSF